MKTFIKVIFNSLILGLILQQSSAESRKSPGVVAISNAASSMNLYKKRTGITPKSWNELIESGYLSGVILKDVEEYAGLTRNYFFMDPPIEIEDGGQLDKVIATSRGPTPEGSSPDIPGRYLIVQDHEGTIRTRKLSEAQLRGWAKRVGFNFDEAVEQAATTQAALRPSRIIPSDPPRDPATPSSEGMQDVANSPSRVRSKRFEPEAISVGWIWFVVVFLIAIGGGIYLWRHYSTRPN